MKRVSTKPAPLSDHYLVYANDSSDNTYIVEGFITTEAEARDEVFQQDGDIERILFLCPSDGICRDVTTDILEIIGKQSFCDEFEHHRCIRDLLDRFKVDYYTAPWTEADWRLHHAENDYKSREASR